MDQSSTENINETVSQYLRGEIDVDEAAAAIFRLQKLGGGFSLNVTDTDTLEKAEALMGRLLGLVTQEVDPLSGVPSQATAADFREFMDQARREIEADDKREEHGLE